MWRLPDSCHEPRGVSAGEGRHVAAPRVLRIGAGPLQMARASLRIRARQNTDRHPGRLACAAAADREPGPARGDCCELARGRRRIRGDQAALPALLDYDPFRSPTSIEDAKPRTSGNVVYTPCVVLCRDRCPPLRLRAGVRSGRIYL